jgi:DNA-binding SARP family transcriptional activator
MTQTHPTSQTSHAHSPAHARLQVLGRFALTLPGGEPATVSRSSQRLLAFLAISRGPVHRSQLSQRLWADSDDSHAASNLRSALWRLPRIGSRPLVAVSTSGVTLSPTLRVDLWDSELHAQSLVRNEDKTDRQPDAVQLLEQDLLPEWSEEWLDVEQESYRQLRLHALEEQSRLLCSEGRFAPALAAALRAVSGEPLRESAHRCVIAVHLAEGNPAEALRQFHSYRRLLARELGLAPSPAIRSMVAALLGRPLDTRPSRKARRG